MKCGSAFTEVCALGGGACGCRRPPPSPAHTLYPTRPPPKTPGPEGGDTIGIKKGRRSGAGGSPEGGRRIVGENGVGLGRGGPSLQMWPQTRGALPDNPSRSHTCRRNPLNSIRTAFRPLLVQSLRRPPPLHARAPSEFAFVLIAIVHASPSGVHMQPN